MQLTKPGRSQSIVAQPTTESDFGTDLLTKAKESSDDDGAGLSSQSKDNDRIMVPRKPTSRHHQKSPANARICMVSLLGRQRSPECG